MGLPKITSPKRGIATFVSMQRGTALPALSPYLHLGSFEGRKGRRHYGRVCEQRGICLREASRGKDSEESDPDGSS